MFISVSSVLSLVIWGNATLLFLYAVCRISPVFHNQNYKFLLWMFGIAILRFLFPFEGTGSISLYFEMELFYSFKHFITCGAVSIFGYNLYIYQILLSIWITGSLLTLIYILRKYRLFCLSIRSILKSSLISPVQSPEDLDIPKSIRIYKGKCILFPMISGMLHPIIFLPKGMFSQKELVFILKHEIWHYRHRDVALKFFMELLCAVYWWNPIIFLLKKRLIILLEIRADAEVCETLSHTERLEYMACLRKFASNPPSGGSSTYGMGFVESGKSSPLHQRVSYLTHSRKHKPSVILAFLFACFTLCSCLMVLEPRPDIEKQGRDKGVFSLSEDFYIIQERDGSYGMYVNNTYLSPVEHPYNISENEPILAIYKYSKEGEVIREYDENKKVSPVVPYVPLLLIVLFGLCIRPKFWSGK